MPRAAAIAAVLKRPSGPEDPLLMLGVLVVTKYTVNTEFFVRSFQGTLGQTHTHKPRKGVRGRRWVAIV
jgi:hypothetical protein